MMSTRSVSPSEKSAREDIGSNALLEEMAGELYRVAAMLLGEGEAAIELVEQTLVTADISSHDPAIARKNGYLTLAGAAIDRIHSDDAQALTAPQGDFAPAGCIGDDDLDAAPVTPAELDRMLNGSDQEHLRGWLEGLSTPLRVIFVLHAPAGLSVPEVAGLLAENGGDAAQDWTPDAVRAIFRQALCSLASQLLHEAAAN
jgi:DNA-directed RNA polymerase specialized sigma24 family protein